MALCAMRVLVLLSLALLNVNLYSAYSYSIALMHVATKPFKWLIVGIGNGCVHSCTHRFRIIFRV